ncbi:hypothetical protein Patl1_17122 [Pistacia atlantica]|uniref:Uncharacterized protein n=1 Tax=Pistacia atlantica TaxID=434234 RepID=A0ACC1B8B4_9ROSI|nr:hypothetical protein Patl1_17122 [Pistacia atlantica]
MFLADQFTQQIPDLEEMKIVNCEEVISFWQRGIRLKQDLGFLRVLVIESCPNFTSMEADEGDGQRELWIPSGLRCLRLNDQGSLVLSYGRTLPTSNQAIKANKTQVKKFLVNQDGALTDCFFDLPKPGNEESGKWTVDQLFT